MGTDEVTMVASFDERFTVTWRDPADAADYWRTEKLHYPYPQAPLTQELFHVYVADVFGGRTTFVNGYAFMAGYKLVEPTPEVRRRGAIPIWRESFLPRIESTVADVRARDYDALAPAEIVDLLPALFHRLASCLFDTITVVPLFIAPAVELARFCEQELGPEGAPLAASLLQGFRNQSTDATAGLQALADHAAARPDLAAALRAGNFDALADLPGGAEFNDLLRAYLDAFGWRAESWCLAHVPTWAEEPSTPLKLIGRYLADPGRSPSVAAKRAVEQREAAAREIESRLAPAKIEQFQRLRGDAEHHVSISEERTFWQLSLMGSVRFPALALGRWLVEGGVVDEPNDVFYFSLDELRQLATEPQARQELVAERRDELLSWAKLEPPEFIGTRPPPSPVPAEAVDFFRYFVGAAAYGHEGQVVKGVAASKGSVRGRARVILELSAADALEPGEVLVCRTTSAPWTPLFAIAGGIVTDTGGLLSHSAICAREYAIPCVTGTRFGTTHIPDGAMITVDGTNGTVTIEG